MSVNPEDPDYIRIEAAWLAKGLTSQELAGRSGVHHQTIGFSEREECSHTLDLSLRIPKFLNQEVSDVLSLAPTRKEQ